MGELSVAPGSGRVAKGALIDAVERVLALARRSGASAAETAASIQTGLSTKVRLGEVERITHSESQALALTIYFGQRRGSASTNDFSPVAIDEAVGAACKMATHAAEDSFSGLADADLMATQVPDLELFHPWPLEPVTAVALARDCEAAAREADSRIRNSEGATVSTSERHSVYGNSHGFIGARRSSRHALSCAVVAQDKGEMQRDYWYSVARASADLEPVAQVGRRAAHRAVRRLGARRVRTQRVPVIYTAEAGRTLLGHFVQAVSGGQLYRRSSFLLDALGRQVFPSGVRLFEQPHLKRGLGSTAFDNDGVATEARDIVRNGVLEGYVLDSYSARKLGMTTTANAGGVHNLTLEPGLDDLSALIGSLSKGMLVTELIGMGVNGVTGDYSRGVAGFWIEGGVIQHAVEEATIAGNLKDMFLQICGVGADLDTRANIRCPSLLIEEMTVAGI